MGEILEYLSSGKLPPRESHNSRMFVDICENIHIHYRELRIVFSIDEYIEFCEILEQSSKDVRNYLYQNPDYNEMEYPTTLMIAGGFERQRKLLQNSPKPNEPSYFPESFTIELQTERVVDEIHVHWRDYRIALNREHFRLIAEHFSTALAKLDSYESTNKYQRLPHHDRTIEDFAIEQSKYSNHKTKAIDEINIGIADIELEKNSTKPPNKSVNFFIRAYRTGECVAPILVTPLPNGRYRIIDGRARVQAQKELKTKSVIAVCLEIKQPQFKLLSAALDSLREFDYQTGHRYGIGNSVSEAIGYKLSKRYRFNFRNAVSPIFFQLARTCLRRGLFLLKRILKTRQGPK